MYVPSTHPTLPRPFIPNEVVVSDQQHVLEDGEEVGGSGCLVGHGIQHTEDFNGISGRSQGIHTVWAHTHARTHARTHATKNNNNED